MTQNATLKSRGLTGIHLAGVFLKRQVQPLQARAHYMWAYLGSNDTNWLGKEELSSNELKTCLRNITCIKATKPIESTRAISTFSAKNPPTQVCFTSSTRFLFSLLNAFLTLEFSLYLFVFALSKF